jgi:TRAP-type uncharacterized transport system fused permease subunit
MFGLGAAMIGFCLAPMNWVERAMFAVGGLMLIDPGVATDVGGLGLLAVALFLQWRKKRGLVTSELPTAAS